MEKYRNDKRLVLGAIFIIFGGLLIVNNLDLMHYGLKRIIFSFGMLVTTIGLFVFATSDNKTPGIVITAVGGFLLLAKIFTWHVGFHTIFWPAVFFGIGAVLIFGRDVLHGGRRAHREPGVGEDYIDEVAVFGGGERLVTSKNFTGGKITAVFGGTEVNLLQAELAEGVHTLEVSYIFGGGTIIVPSDWKVRVDVVSIFGGFSDKRKHTSSYVVEPQKELVIKGVAIFGGGEIKSFK